MLNDYDFYYKFQAILLTFVLHMYRDGGQKCLKFNKEYLWNQTTYFNQANTIRREISSSVLLLKLFCKIYCIYVYFIENTTKYNFD